MFVIACVIFDDDIDAEFATANIRLLKKQLGWKQEREFKFHRASEDQKLEFFRMVKKLKFHIRAVVVDKTLISEPKLKKSDSFYSFIITSVLQRFTKMNKAKIRLDGSGSRDFRRRSTSGLRKSINQNKSRKITSFALADSRDEVLIQLADMVAGAIRIKHDPDRSVKHDYSRSFKDKIEDLWIYD